MKIRQTTLKTSPRSQSLASDSVPKMEAPVGDSFSFSGLDIDKTDTKYILGYTALGAIGGALGGHFGGGALSTTVLTGTSSAVVCTVGTAVDALVNPHPMNDAAVVLAPVLGGGAGIVSGLLGVGLRSATGMGPVVSGAITGAITEFALTSLIAQAT